MHLVGKCLKVCIFNNMNTEIVSFGYLVHMLKTCYRFFFNVNMDNS